MPNRHLSACPVPGWRLLAMAAVILSGCSTAEIDKLPKEFGGLPADAPQRPAQAPAFPGVFETPPARPTALLDAEQQQKLEADLVAARNRQSPPQKNASKGKQDAKSQAKSQAKSKSKAGSPTAARQPSNAASPAASASGQAGSGAPPWPLPPQTTGGSARP